MGFWKNDVQDRPTAVAVRRSFGKYGWLPGVLVGILCLGIGAAQGQLVVIWRKAVMICLECIGIG